MNVLIGARREVLMLSRQSLDTTSRFSNVYVSVFIDFIQKKHFYGFESKDKLQLFWMQFEIARKLIVNQH